MQRECESFGSKVVLFVDGHMPQSAVVNDQLLLRGVSERIDDFFTRVWQALPKQGEIDFELWKQECV